MSSQVHRPRLCHIVKWPDFPGYGFNLHAEKGKAGQFIGSVDADSPAQVGGLKEGDRIVEVNGVNIGNENHQQVVTRIKSGGEETRLLVVDIETDNYYKENKIVVKGDLPEVQFFTARRDSSEEESVQALPEPEPEPEPDHVYDMADPAPEPEPPVVVATTNGVSSSSPPNDDESHRPRLCHLKTWPNFQGYGFNLHAERDKPGQFIGLVDDNSPAQAAGLRVNDRIIEVNGVNVEGQAHPDVIARIKAVPGETRLLVLDRESDAYYKERGVTVHSDLPQVDRIITPDTDPSLDVVVAENGAPDAEVAESQVEVNDVVKEKKEEVAEQQQQQEEVVKAEAAVVAEAVADLQVEEPEQEKQEEVPEESPVQEIENIVSEEVALEAPPQQEEDVQVETEVTPEPVNGIKSAPAPEPEPEFAVAPTPAPEPVAAPPAKSSDVDGLELNLSVAEMKERLKARKKHDPRTDKKLTFEQKYKDFERM